MTNYVSQLPYEENMKNYLEKNYSVYTDIKKYKETIAKINTARDLSVDERIRIIQFKPKTEIELSLVCILYN